MAGNGTAPDDATYKNAGVLPPAALASAIIMIVMGIVIILLYGFDRTKAWKVQQTYVFDDEAAQNPRHEGPTCGENNVDDQNVLSGQDADEEAVEGLDDSLNASLLAPSTRL